MSTVEHHRQTGSPAVFELYLRTKVPTGIKRLPCNDVLGEISSSWFIEVLLELSASVLSSKPNQSALSANKTIQNILHSDWLSTKATLTLNIGK